MSGPELSFLGHSTVRVELAGRTVLTDPLLTAGVGPLRRVVRLPDPATWAGVDLVLISHLHGDHLHPASLRLLGTAIRVVVPRGGAAWLRRHGFTPRRRALARRVADRRRPAHHRRPRRARRPPVGPADHPRAEHPVARPPDRGRRAHRLRSAATPTCSPACPCWRPRRVDVALLPVWGWGPSLGPGHLDPVRAAEAVARVQPRIAVPVHWGTLAMTGTRLPGRLGARMAPAPGRPAAGVRRRGRRPRAGHPGRDRPSRADDPSPLDRLGCAAPGVTVDRRAGRSTGPTARRSATRPCSSAS